jgi:hypothetical protein
MTTEHIDITQSTEAQFCPDCGRRTEPGDRFCRSCGHAQDGAPPVSAPTPPPRRRGRKALVALALVALAGAAAALVLVLGGAFADGESDEAAAARGRLEAQRARLNSPFEELMHRRDEMFSYERRYLNAMTDAREKITRYRRADQAYNAEFKRIDEEFADEFDQCMRFAAIPCPEPDYPDLPDVPGFAKQTKQLRGIVNRLEELRAGLTAVQPEDELSVLHTQLLSSVDALKAEASHNADVLDEAVEPAQDESVGSMDKGKIRTLRSGSALPAIRQLNLAAVEVIDRLELRKLDHDVPGGRDLDPADHSDAA